MPLLSIPVSREEKHVLVFLGMALLSYLIIMDTILYSTLQGTTLVADAKFNGTSMSPFYPLTMKLLVSEEWSQFFIKPVAAGFEYYTNFSRVFYFISPNMISFFHVLVAFVAGKLVASERIRIRWIGLVLFEFRTWLDGVDGVVARERNGQSLYRSHRNSFGHVVDIIADVTGSAVLCIGALVFLCKHFDKKRNELSPVWTRNGSGASKQRVNGANGSHNNGVNIPSRKAIFWKMLCFGAMIGLGSTCWDITTAGMERVFETPLMDPRLAKIQTDILHSNITWFFIVLWRFAQGAKLLQLLVLSIAINKLWEFISLVQYWGYLFIISAFITTHCYIQYIKSMLNM